MIGIGAAMMVAASLCTASAQFALKSASVGTRAARGVGACVLLYATSLTLMVLAYRLDDLTALTPLLSLSVVWTVVLAVRWLGERMTPRRWIGVALIVGGSMLVAA